jgi:hypothetical protein
LLPTEPKEEITVALEHGDACLPCAREWKLLMEFEP